MADMTLAEAIAEVKPHSNWNGAHFLPTLFRAEIRDAIATILNAVLSGDLIPRTDAEMAVAEAIRRAAQEAHDWFYDPEHDRVTDPRLGEAILALAPADALAEVQRMRARVANLRHQITEASDPDFIWGALDNVHDAETTLDDYASAVSRAIRGAMQIIGEAE